MKYVIQRTSQFKKDYKTAKKHGLDLTKLRAVIELLADGERLPEQYLERPLKGDYNGCLECHIEPDWLLFINWKMNC